jgi:hypothetical protein
MSVPMVPEPSESVFAVDVEVHTARPRRGVPVKIGAVLAGIVVDS